MPRRESRYVRVARLAYAIAQEALPWSSHPKSPQYPYLTLSGWHGCCWASTWGGATATWKNGCWPVTRSSAGAGTGPRSQHVVPHRSGPAEGGPGVDDAVAFGPARGGGGGRGRRRHRVSPHAGQSLQPEPTGTKGSAMGHRRWGEGRGKGPDPSHPARGEPVGPEATDAGGVGGAGAPGRALRTAVEERDGSLGDPTPVWRQRAIPQARAAAAGSGHESPGLQPPPLTSSSRLRLQYHSLQQSNL